MLLLLNAVRKDKQKSRQANRLPASKHEMLAGVELDDLLLLEELREIFALG